MKVFDVGHCEWLRFELYKRELPYGSETEWEVKLEITILRRLTFILGFAKGY
jgi:hypothetical protein